MKTHEDECEFYEPTAEYFEDGAYIIHQRCQECEVYGSTTCDRLDGTFYDEGPRCEVIKKTRLDPTALYREQDNGEWYEMVTDEETIWDWYDDGNPTLDWLLEELDDTIQREITVDSHSPEVQFSSNQDSDIVQMDREDFDGPIRIYIEHVGQTFRIDYDNKSVSY